MGCVYIHHTVPGDCDLARAVHAAPSTVQEQNAFSTCQFLQEITSQVRYATLGKPKNIVVFVIVCMNISGETCRVKKPRKLVLPECVFLNIMFDVPIFYL